MRVCLEQFGSGAAAVALAAAWLVAGCSKPAAETAVPAAAPAATNRPPPVATLPSDPAVDPAADPAAPVGASIEDLMKAWRAGEDLHDAPVENLALPIDHHPDGRVRAMLHAASARVPPNPDGFIRARDVTVEMYDENGRLDAIFTAENCIYDRRGQSGYCEGKVRIERLGVRITGVDMVWKVQERSAKILSQAEVRAERMMKGMGGLFK